MTCAQKSFPVPKFIHNVPIQEDIEGKFQRCCTNRLLKIKITRHMPPVTEIRLKRGELFPLLNMSKIVR